MDCTELSSLQSNQQAVVYNLSLSLPFSGSPIEHTLYGHTRAVTDINWSPGAPEVLATCAMDGWVMAWDLRTGYGSTGRGRKPIWRVCGWGCASLPLSTFPRIRGRCEGDKSDFECWCRSAAPATQVKFNRREPHVIASSHDNVVHVWDDRVRCSVVLLPACTC